MISSTICIEYCRGAAEHHKYALIDSDRCTCALDVSFDVEMAPNNQAASPKWLTNKCSWSASKTMIGNADNNVVALYNIDYANQFVTSKLAPATCRVYEHELFYTSYGMERLSLQSDILLPVLKVKCDFQQSNLCLKPLLHTLPSSRYQQDFAQCPPLLLLFVYF